MKLKPVHHEAVLLFVAGVGNKDISKKLKVTPETVSIWKHDYAIQAEINKILLHNSNAVSDKLRALSSIALETIEAIMQDKEAAPKERLTASLKILELNRVRPSSIGATNEAVLKKEAEQDDLLNSYGL